VITLALSRWLILAQAATKPAGDAGAGGGAPAANQAPGFASMLPALIGIMALFYFLILRPQKAKEQQFRSMVDSLKETDRVVTIGGIHGVVTRRDDDIVTLRIDDSTGTKIRVSKSAIARVVTEGESGETTKPT
jgi:preprotein translocase subunit YajC